MTLIDFVQGIRISGDSVTFYRPSLDAYLAEVFPAEIKQDPARFIFAATSHVALMTLSRTLVDRGAVVGVAGKDDLALRAALTGTRPDLVFSFWPNEQTSFKDNRVLRCLLLEGSPQRELLRLPQPPHDDPYGVTLVRALLPGTEVPSGEPWSQGMLFNFPHVSLLVQP
ncbi:hypothetical protein [Roseomonas chloroacetimidivorans]|uniref:hypothetical protein n=1 Tax=Roseomonas chloroacetimidivorans TaxID=1766656 RepID=UPI003C77840C